MLLILFIKSDMDFKKNTMKLNDHIKNILIDSMERNQYNKTLVSRELGMSLRWVRYTCKKYNINNERIMKTITYKQRDAYYNKNR